MLIDAPRKTSKAKKKKAPSLPSYPTPAPKRAAPRPTPQQLRTAKAAERSYRSQGTAVKRAVTEKKTGLTYEQRHREPQKVSGGRAPQERYYRSQGRGVERQGTRKTTGLTGAQIERLLKADRKQTKASGFSARERYGYTPAVTKHNVMPVPKELEKAKKLGYLERDPKKLKRAGFAAPGALEEFVSSPKYAIKAISNIPKDVGEIAVTTPTSLAHLGVRQYKAVDKSVKEGSPMPFLREQGKLAKETFEPYKQAYKDPVKFFTERPVTSALMFLPAGRFAKLGGGRVARVAGKQELHRPAATLPGTSLQQIRVGSRSVTKRAKQKAEDEKQGAARISTKGTPRRPSSDLERDVDEFFDLSQQQRAATRASATKQLNIELGARMPLRQKARAVSPRKTTREAHAKEAAERRKHRGERMTLRRKARALSRDETVREAHAAEKAERIADVQEKLSGAVAGAGQFNMRNFARRYGSHWEVKPGLGGKPSVRKYAPGEKPEDSGVIHATKEEADRVIKSIKADKTVTWEPRRLEIEGDTPGVTAGYAVVPEQAIRRLEQHQTGVGKAGWGAGPLLRVTSRQFRRTVLPQSTKWLGGQVVEGAVRSTAHSGSPVPVINYMRGKRYIKAVQRTTTQDAIAAGMSKAKAEKLGEQTANELQMRAISGGQFGVTGPAAEYARHGEDQMTMAKEFAGSSLEPAATAFTKLWGKPGFKHSRQAFRKAAEVIFNDINGPIETFYKTGMLGTEVKRTPLMEKRIVGLTEKALDEAARDMKGTSSQMQLARSVERAYGQYSKFSPTMRDTIMHSTPFIPWMLNMSKFLFAVMPADHPAKTSLLASYAEADREWREKNNLSFYKKGRVPDFIMGSYPSEKGKYIPAGRFGPFAPADITGAIAGQYLPHVYGIAENLRGRDWKGEEIPGGQGRRISNAALTGAEAMIPLVGPAGRVTGLSDRYVRGKKDKESVVQGKSVKQGVLDVLNPVKPIDTTQHSKSKRKKKPASSVRGGSSVRGSVRGGSSIR